MFTKFFYIVPGDVAVSNLHRFRNFHYVNLPDGRVLLSGEFHDEQFKQDWERNASALPVAHGGDTVSEEHATVLDHLGVKPGHSHKQLRSLVRKHHPLM